jgi:hypothetical protein
VFDQWAAQASYGRLAAVFPGEFGRCPRDDFLRRVGAAAGSWRLAVNAREVVTHRPSTGQALVKHWSNTGQRLVKSWANAGPAPAKKGRGGLAAPLVKR